MCHSLLSTTTTHPLTGFLPIPPNFTPSSPASPSPRVDSCAIFKNTNYSGGKIKAMGAMTEKDSQIVKKGGWNNSKDFRWISKAFVAKRIREINFGSKSQSKA